MTLSESEKWKFGHKGYKRLKESARKRKIPFEIKTSEDLMNWWKTTNDRCYWCNISSEKFNSLKDTIVKLKSPENPTLVKLANWMRNYKSNYLSIDRVDSNKGYAINNIVKSCPICNYIKGFLLNGTDMKLIAPRVRRRIRDMVRENKNVRRTKKNA